MAVILKQGIFFGIIGFTALLLGLPVGEVQPRAPKAQDAKAVTIPLDSMYATMPQKPVQWVVAAFHFPSEGKQVPSFPYSYDLSRIYERGGGASNVFLAFGEDITEAIRSTRAVVAGGISVSSPVDNGYPNSKSKKLWLVAYLGISSSEPTAWVVHSVTLEKQTIRVSYSKPERLCETCDSVQYIIWAPLGELEAKTYTLELFDVNQQQVTLLRRVTHTAK